MPSPCLDNTLSMLTFTTCHTHFFHAESFAWAHNIQQLGSRVQSSRKTRQNCLILTFVLKCMSLSFLVFNAWWIMLKWDRPNSGTDQYYWSAKRSVMGYRISESTTELINTTDQFSGPGQLSGPGPSWYGGPCGDTDPCAAPCSGPGPCRKLAS